jgi:threonine aldolase
VNRKPPERQFASDNYSGICPEALDAIQSANHSHSPSYGDDAWTRDAADEIRQFFGLPCEVFFVFNGTAANSLALASLCQSYHSVICHEVAHVETDECGAPEFFSNGTKLLTSHGADGKLDPAGIDALVTKRSDIHYPKPRVVSVTLPTEVGTLYTLEELRDIRESARRSNLFVHLDGARFFNAVDALGKEPREIIHALGPRRALPRRHQIGDEPGRGGCFL